MEKVTSQSFARTKAFLEENLPLSVSPLSYLGDVASEEALSECFVELRNDRIVSFLRFSDSGAAFFIASDSTDFEAVADCIRSSPIILNKLTSDYESAARLWKEVFGEVAPSLFVRRELFFHLILRDSAAGIDPRVRPLRGEDYSQWHALYRALLTMWGAPQSWIDEPLKAEFAKYVATRRAIGLFEEGMLRSTATLSDSYHDWGRVGFVFTDPAHRKQGLAQKTLALLHAVAREQGVTQLSLFTNEKNFPAHALYESLGYGVKGDIGILARMSQTTKETR